MRNMLLGDQVEYVDPITQEAVVLTYTGTRREVKGVDMDFFTTPKGETIFLYPSEVAKMKKTILSGLFVALVSMSTLFGQTNSLTIAWDANTDTTVVGHKLYVSTNFNTYATSNIANVTTYTFNIFKNTTYTMFLTATNVQGLESEPSNKVRYTGYTLINSRTNVFNLSNTVQSPTTTTITKSPVHGRLIGTFPNLMYVYTNNVPSTNDSFVVRTLESSSIYFIDNWYGIQVSLSVPETPVNVRITTIK